MAALIGVISAFVALALLRLIGFFTHPSYYHAIDSRLISPADNRLGVWALLVPIVGGLIVGLMARYGSERIRGHGIPERSRRSSPGRAACPPGLPCSSRCPPPFPSGPAGRSAPVPMEMAADSGLSTATRADMRSLCR